MHVHIFFIFQGPPRFARLGPGSRWSRVLSIIDPAHYTIVHGQCTDVGVGGFLLGGGVNVAGSTSKYGLGSENVVEYTMVSAEGEVVTVNEDRIVKRTYDGHEVSFDLIKFAIFVINYIKPGFFCSDFLGAE